MIRMLLKYPILLLVIAIYSSCEVTSQGYDLSNADDACKASGALCDEPTGAALLSLSISNANPYTVKNPANRVFDIAGLCNEADYSENIIEYTVIEPSTNTIVVPTTKAYNLCKRGEYRIQIYIPTPANVNIVNRLRLELVGKDLNGNEDRNPLAAQREVDLLSI